MENGAFMQYTNERDTKYFNISLWLNISVNCFCVRLCVSVLVSTLSSKSNNHINADVK